MTTTEPRTPRPRATLRPPAGDPDVIRRRELAAFLRSRRERTTPEQVGLPAGGRRRTPGLRREELAQHAGVGVTWYTWLEQGRDIRVSEQVLGAIARTLSLDPHERSHLFTLAGSPLVAIEAECKAIGPEIHALLEKLHPYPACVSNGRYDLLAYNRAYAALVGDLDALAFDQRNSLWLAFTSPTWRATMVAWEEGVRRMVGQYRAAMADHVAEPAWKCLVKRLQEASAEFAELWGRHDVLAPENLTKLLRHPELGLLRLNYTNLWLAPRTGRRLVTYMPADEVTAARLVQLDGAVPRALYPEEALTVSA